MYHITNTVFRQLEESRANNSTYVNLTLFHTLTANFQEMKRLNEFFLLDYQRLADLSHSLLDHLTYGLMAVLLVFSLTLSILANHYFKFRFEQRRKSYDHFALIPSVFVEKMKQYYINLQGIAEEDQRLNRIERNEDALMNN